MSHTYPTRPTRANQTRQQVPRKTQPNDTSLRNNEATPETSAQERMVRVDGAFTVIPPNERKRDAIQRVAKKEEENYNKFKARRNKVYNEVGTPGGGLLEKPKPSPSSSGLSNRNYLRSKREEYRSTVKNEENKKLEEFKSHQRQKTITNKETEKQRHLRLESDRRKRNEAFLNKLESKQHEELAKNSRHHDYSPENFSNDAGDSMDDCVAALCDQFPELEIDLIKGILTDCGNDHNIAYETILSITKDC